jgi:hypothetical protein
MMQLLTKPEEVMLVKFHETKGDRIGARPGDFLPTQTFNERETETEGIDFEGVRDSLLAHHLIERDEERDGYVLTQEGYDYLYTREGGRRITEE